MQGPRLVGELLMEFLQSEEPLAVAIRHAVEHGQMPSMAKGKPAALEDWVSGSIVCDMLDISERTLQTLRTNGTLPFSKLGGKVYYRRQDIEQVLQDHLVMWRLHNPEGYGSTRK